MRQTFVCSDAETTEPVGPKPRHLRRQPHVTEFAVVTVTLDEDGEKPEAMNVLVNPTVTIPLKSVRRIGISQANVEQQPEFSHFAPTIQAILARADIRCGHSLISDGRMLDIEFGHTGQQGRAEEQGRAAVWQAHHLFGPAPIAAVCRTYRRAARPRRDARHPCLHVGAAHGGRPMSAHPHRLCPKSAGAGRPDRRTLDAGASAHWPGRCAAATAQGANHDCNTKKRCSAVPHPTQIVLLNRKDNSLAFRKTRLNYRFHYENKEVWYKFGSKLYHDLDAAAWRNNSRSLE